MDKISVIIPTIQKNINVLASLLKTLTEDRIVDEVLVINNSEKRLIIPLEKVCVLNQRKNLFVNASWNLGIELIKNNVFLIINDDILPCVNFCSKIYDSGLLEAESTGLVGLDNSFIRNVSRDTEFLEKPEDVGNPSFTGLAGILMILL